MEALVLQARPFVEQAVENEEESGSEEESGKESD